MWENETVVLVTSLKKRILGGKERVRFERIQTDDTIPGFIKRLFMDRVNLYLIKESPLVLQNTPHFNLGQAELERLRNQSHGALIEAATFFEKEVEAILQEALVLRLEYLIKPVTTLKERLFEKGALLAVTQIEDLVEPFRKTLPYGDYLVKTCMARGLTQLDQKTYASILESWVSQQASQDGVSWLVREFIVLTDYLSESKGEEISKLQGQVVQDFLLDRSQTGFHRAVDVEIKLGRQEFSSSDLEMTLRRYQELKIEFVATPIPQPGVEETKISTEPEPEASSVESELPVLDLDEAWQIDDFQPGQPQQGGEESDLKPAFLLDDEPEEAPPVVKVETRPVQVEEPVEISVPADDQSKGSSEEEEGKQPPKGMRIIRRDPVEASSKTEPASTPAAKAAPPAVDLRPLIDNRTEKSFVKKLFSGDGEAYQKLLDKLEDAESWRVAKILIDNELFKRDVDPFSREAIKLVDLVYGRYYPEENVGG